MSVTDMPLPTGALVVSDFKTELFMDKMLRGLKTPVYRLEGDVRC